MIAVDDEIPGAEKATYIPIDEFMAHFHLTDEGEFKFGSLGSAGEVAIQEVAYPLITQTILDGLSGGGTGPTPKQMRTATEKERHRVPPRPVPEPDTEIGKRIKKETDLPTSLVNRMVKSHTVKALKKAKMKGRLVN